MAESKCPLPTQDIKTNLANRQKAIDVAHYGPANPKEPNEEYWTAKAKIFGGSVKEAKTMRCSNCAGFNQTSKLIDCISKGIGSDAQEVEQAGDLGYCEIFDFKCASLRTCDAWIVGGPITDKTNLEQLKADLLSLKEQGATLLYDPSQARDESGRWSGGGGGFKGKLIEKAQKENPSLDMAKSSVKGAIKGVVAIANGARVAGQYGASKAYQIKNWLSSDNGQKFLHGVARVMSVGSKGAIEAIKSAHGDRYRILIGTLINPEIGAVIASQSAFKGFVRGAVAEYNKIEGGRQVSNIVRKGIGIRPMSAQGNVVMLEKDPDMNDVADYLADNIAVAIREEIEGKRIFEVATFAYDPSQQRDESGKWTGGGGIAQGATPTPKWAQDNPAEASKKTGEATTLYHGTSADVLKDIRKDGLKPSKSGVWGGGKVYSTDSLDLAFEYGVLRSGTAPKIGGKQLIGIISVLAEGFKSVADNIPTTKAQKMGKTGMAAVSKIFTKNGGVAPSAIKKMQIFDVDSIRKYVYENGPKPSPLATKELAEGSQLIYVPIVIQLPDDGSEGFQFDDSVAVESFVFQYNGEKIEFYDPNQPRDEKGRWAGGGGGIKSSKASGKAKQVSETSESQDNEDVDSMVKRLENEPKARKAISDMNKLRQQTADREGISFDDASVTRWSLRDPSRYKQSKDIVETLRNPTPHHREWINQQVKEGLNPNAKSENPVAVILMGSPASGKTTTGRPFANKILGGQQVTTIDPDSIKAKSHGFQGWNAGAFHDESAIIAEKMIMPRATQERHNMLIDITGQNSTKVSEMAKNLKALGYTVGVVHIDVDDKTALGRASQRFNKPNGRWVPPSYIKGAADKARNTWNKLTKDNLIDIGYQVDGNVSRTKGEAPVKETYGKIFE